MNKILAYVVSLLVVPLLAEIIHNLFFYPDMGKFRLLMVIGLYITNSIAIFISSIVIGQVKKFVTSTLYTTILFVGIYEISSLMTLKSMSDSWYLMPWLSLNITYGLGLLGYYGWNTLNKE